MKYIILIIIITVAAIGLIAWLQEKPLVKEQSISVTTSEKTPVEEIQGIDIGNADTGFESVDANIQQL